MKYKSMKGKRIDYISCYEIETDELLAQFDTYRECARYFNTSVGVIMCNISRKNRKRYKNKWYRLIPTYRKCK